MGKIGIIKITSIDEVSRKVRQLKTEKDAVGMKVELVSSRIVGWSVEWSVF